MGYDTEFTEDNKRVLESAGLSNVELQNQTGPGNSVNISWTQTMKNPLGCEETYQECTYKIAGTDTKVMVFIAKECGTPPDRINTQGCQMGEGRLHFGYVFDDDDPGTKAVFFVIHPNSWGPYQKRFRTSGLLRFFHSAVSSVTSKVAAGVAGAAIGQVAIPIPLVGAAIGGAAGVIASSLGDALLGDYLRYIG